MREFLEEVAQAGAVEQAFGQPESAVESPAGERKLAGAETVRFSFFLLSLWEGPVVFNVLPPRLLL